MNQSQFDELIDSSPFIDENLKKDCKRYLKQIPTSISSDWIYSKSLPEITCQGDVTDRFDIVFHEFVGDSSEIRSLEDHPCILISHTCDMDLENKTREKFISIAPIFDYEEFAAQKYSGYSEERWNSFLESVKSNRITDILFLPGKESVGDFIVLLDRIYSFDSKILNIRLKTKMTNRLISLSQIGYYYFLIKLTYHFARYENRSEVRRG